MTADSLPKVIRDLREAWAAASIYDPQRDKFAEFADRLDAIAARPVAYFLRDHDGTILAPRYDGEGPHQPYIVDLFNKDHPERAPFHCVGLIIGSDGVETKQDQPQDIYWGNEPRFGRGPG